MEKAQYRKSKFGCVPGDVYKGVKIAMLEGRHPDESRSKSFQREHHRRANRRFRHEARSLWWLA